MLSDGRLWAGAGTGGWSLEEALGKLETAWSSKCGELVGLREKLAAAERDAKSAAAQREHSEASKAAELQDRVDALSRFSQTS